MRDIDNFVNTDYIGVLIQRSFIPLFWEIKCPCGIVVTYPLNELPTEDTMHPCKNPNHWAVKYKE